MTKHNKPGAGGARIGAGRKTTTKEKCVPHSVSLEPSIGKALVKEYGTLGECLRNYYAQAVAMGVIIPENQCNPPP